MAKKYLLLLFLVFTFPLIILYSQETKNAVEIMISPAGDTIAIVEVSLSDITTKLEQANDQIKKIEGRLEPRPEIIEFDSIYLVESENLITKKEKVQSEDNTYTMSSIEDAKREWTANNEKISQWKDKINTRIKTLENDLFNAEVL